MGKKVSEDYRAGYRVARGFHESQRAWAVDYERLLDGSSDDYRAGFMAYVGNHVRTPAPAGLTRKAAPMTPSPLSENAGRNDR